MTLKKKRENAAEGINRGTLSDEQVAVAIREQQRYAVEDFLDWINHHGGFRTIEDGNEPPIDELLDFER